MTVTATLRLWNPTGGLYSGPATIYLTKYILRLKFKAICILRNSSFVAETDVQFHLEITKKAWLLILEVGIAGMVVYLV